MCVCAHKKSPPAIHLLICSSRLCLWFFRKCLSSTASLCRTVTTVVSSTCSYNYSVVFSHVCRVCVVQNLVWRGVIIFFSLSDCYIQNETTLSLLLLRLGNICMILLLLLIRDYLFRLLTCMYSEEHASSTRWHPLHFTGHLCCSTHGYSSIKMNWRFLLCWKPNFEGPKVAQILAFYKQSECKTVNQMVQVFNLITVRSRVNADDNEDGFWSVAVGSETFRY